MRAVKVERASQTYTIDMADLLLGGPPDKGYQSASHIRPSTTSPVVQSLTPDPSGWNFFTDADPTHGLVNFVDGDAAKKLAYVQSDNTVVLAVDDSDGIPVGGKRNSIRISSKKAYTRGLFVADIFAMPHGCGVWPAYWSLGTGKDWPNAGEIDIIGEFSFARRLSSVAVGCARVCAHVRRCVASSCAAWTILSSPSLHERRLAD